MLCCSLIHRPAYSFLVQIFTDDQDEVKELDRVRVVQHLEETCQDNPEIVQQYLVSSSVLRGGEGRGGEGRGEEGRG